VGRIWEQRGSVEVLCLERGIAKGMSRHTGLKLSLDNGSAPSTQLQAGRQQTIPRLVPASRSMQPLHVTGPAPPQSAFDTAMQI
jgi:hypothetical protein